MIDGNFGNVSAGVLFSKVESINENGGKLIKFLRNMNNDHVKTFLIQGNLKHMIIAKSTS